jgi:hypothetical protein
LRLGIPISLSEILKLRVKTYQSLLIAITALQERGALEKDEAEAKKELKAHP